MIYEFEPIGYLESCFQEKFGVPRQSGLVSHATGIIRLRPDPHLKIALRSLETFSHLWLIFVFHQPGSRHWKPSVRPPRLGGARKVGVLASRSPHRPNPIGISAVSLDRIELNSPLGPEIHVHGIDLLNGTPILDLKPYLPYADSIPTAQSGWAQEPILRIGVQFSKKALEDLQVHTPQYPSLKELITEILELDPRPAFQKKRFPPEAQQSQGTSYGFKLFEFDIQWKIQNGIFLVISIP